MVLDIIFNLKGTPCWILKKNVFPPLEPKLLVMWERISEALQVFCEVLETVKRLRYWPVVGKVTVIKLLRYVTSYFFK